MLFRFKFLLKSMVSITIALSIISAASVRAEEPAKPVDEPDNLVIVKYGSLSVKCDEPGARIYVDDVYKGSANNIIEGIVTGTHVISCKTDDKAASGTFQVKKNETLRLEANLNSGKIGQLHEHAPEPVKSSEPAERNPARHERPKKPEPRKVEQKDPAEDRRKIFLTVIKVRYTVSDSQAIHVDHSMNQHVISKFDLEKNVAGKYYRTKQGLLLCEKGPCELNWNARFMYTDENNKTDALLLNWKETVFNGITPSGTSRQDLECCLNGQCWKMKDTSTKNAPQEFEIGRYRLVWSDSSVVIRRGDILKEILDAGRSLSEY